MATIELSTSASALQNVLPRNLVALLIANCQSIRLPAKKDAKGNYVIRSRFLANRLARIEGMTTACKRWLTTQARKLRHEETVTIPDGEAEIVEVPEIGTLVRTH